MVDPSIYTDYYKSVKSCSQAAQREFSKIWAILDFGDLGWSRTLLLELLPGVVSKYGDAAATAAAEMYEAVCLAETGKAVVAELAEPSVKKIRRSVQYASSIMAKGDFQKAFSELRKAVDYYVKDPARMTVENSAKRDGARWARVPTGPETCEFCVMLASRGFVYHSETTAKGKHGYHTDCDCMPVPSFKADTVVPDYDPDHYYQMYRQMEDKSKWNRARQKNV